jgi:lipopolysaccharide transport system ATP-binding protein
MKMFPKNGVDGSALDREDAAEDTPTIFHITHWKAGSQWIHKILVGCASERIVPPQLHNVQFLNRPLQPGKVYPTVYVTKQQFDSVRMPSHWRRFVVIRDLRDTLISDYFSLKVSHAVLNYRLARWRLALQSLSMEDGLLCLMDERLPRYAAIQASWLEAGERLLRYEDLLKNDVDILEQVLLDECELPVSRERFREVVRANRFEQLTKGRPRGQEDVTAHERKGIAGDWRNYFSERVTQTFWARYGGLLIATGYEEEQAFPGKHYFSLNDVDLKNTMKPTEVERLLSESIQGLTDQVAEKEKAMQTLHAEAERRREALEAVTADRDAWEARYRQLATEHEAMSQSPLPQSHIQRTIELERALEEKERIIQTLHAEAERRREVLEAVAAQLDAMAQRPSPVPSESLAASVELAPPSQIGINPAVSLPQATVAPVGPLVTIVTPSYNQGRFIEETILSVLTQDYPNIEYIVIDGGSTDNTLDILKKYEERLAWISESDRGQSHAINKGFRMAKGEILAWLNSDDTYLPGAIGKVVQHFQANPESMMVYGEGYLIDEQSRVTKRFPFTEAFNLWKLVYLWDNILQQTAFFRRQVFDHIDLLDENLHYGMDWDLWIRIGKKFRVDYIQEYLGNLREYSEAKTFSGGTPRFNELVSLMRRHGTMRFPPAYFTYGFSTYNRRMFGRLAHRYPRAYRFLFSIPRLLGQRVCNLITHYLVNHSQGYYSDGWASPKAHFLLANPGQASYLRLEGECISLRRGYQTGIRARVNGRPLGDPITVFPGNFKLKWPIPIETRSSDLFEVTLLASRWHRPPLADADGDRRRLSYRITQIAVE